MDFDFLAVMLFTRKAFHLECLHFFWLFFMFEIVIIRIKSQPGVAYKKASSIVSYSSKNDGITLPHEFIFVFIYYFIGVILSKKSVVKSGGFRLKIIKGVV